MDIPRQPRRIKGVVLTPLIDIFLLLLIFFMLSTNFMVTESMELILPSATQAKKKLSHDVMRVVVADDGSLYLDGESIIRDDLNSQLRAALGRNPDRGILVQSTNRVTVQELVSVMDVAYLAGARNLSVATWNGAF